MLKDVNAEQMEALKMEIALREEKIQQEQTKREHQIKVLELSMEAGQILLENGAEVFRVEETMNRICQHYGIESSHLFVLSNGIFITAGSEKEPLYAKVTQLPINRSRLDKVCAVNQLSREIAEGKYSVDEAIEAIKNVRLMEPKSLRMQVLAGGLGTGAFCCLFGGSLGDMAAAGLAGLLLRMMQIAYFDKYNSKMVGTICGGAFITCVCILLHCMYPVLNLSNMVIGSVMLLVPGVAFVNGIRDLANSDYLAGTVRVLDALFRFICIAIGVGGTFLLYSAIFGGAIL